MVVVGRKRRWRRRIEIEERRPGRMRQKEKCDDRLRV
jgi:hypothetical protein